ncbi:hypothetical protein HXT54_04560 [Gardnerella sp. KA00603]|nr:MULTISPECIES: hypothetical protein [Gardnerella]MDF0753765.1 hypothetical protein [Gardnerella greenwoodii]
MKHDSNSHNSSTRTTSEGSDTIGSSSSDVPPEYMKPAITAFRLQRLQK